MKLDSLNELKQESVTQCNQVEKATVLSPEELKRVVGGVTMPIEGHSHYSYWVCTDVGC